jgi:hypothetical protein
MGGPEMCFRGGNHRETESKGHRRKVSLRLRSLVISYSRVPQLPSPNKSVCENTMVAHLHLGLGFHFTARTAHRFS